MRPKARVRHRTAIVVDDGIATGSTMVAALRMLKDAVVHELIAAVPVAAGAAATAPFGRWAVARQRAGRRVGGSGGSGAGGRYTELQTEACIRTPL